MSEHDTQAKPSNVTAKPIRLKLPYPISANRYWRTRVAGKIAVTYVSAEAKSYKSIVAWMATAAGAKPIIGPVKMDLCLCPKQNKDGSSSKVRFDLSNSIKVLEDALNGVAYVDDKQVVAIQASVGRLNLMGRCLWWFPILIIRSYWTDMIEPTVIGKATP